MKQKPLVTVDVYKRQGLYWAVTFGIVFWSALCVRSIFTLGPVRYFKERTVTGWCCRWMFAICRWVKKYCVRFLDSIIETDWQEKSNKTILKIVIDVYKRQVWSGISKF